MSNLVRILLVIACIAAFYYLVVVLARSVAEEELGRLDADPGVEFVPGRAPLHTRDGLLADLTSLLG